MTQPDDPQSFDQRFVSYLAGLVEREDRGALATLRHASDPDSPRYLGAYRYLARWSQNRWTEERNRLVAELFARWHRARPYQPAGGNMGDHAQALARDGHEEAVTRRFERLITAHRDDLVPHLRSMCDLLRSQDIRINWAQLSRDVAGWDHPDRFVQRRWAERFFRTAPEGADNQ